MNRGLMYALALPLLAAEVWAQFAVHDQRWTTVFAVLALGVLAVRYLLGPTEAEAECLPDCPKCRESKSLEGDR
ncbi:hypothetical protein [Streptomyces sp. NPDC002402]